MNLAAEAKARTHDQGNESLHRGKGRTTSAALETTEDNVTLIELLTICDEAYAKDFPESSLLELVNKRSGKPLKRLPSPIGDTLALFVVRELSETFDAEASDEQQITETVRVMEMARGNLDNIIMALNERCQV
jgi:hypothetical protein